MILTRLQLRNFRNYQAQELRFAPGLSVFVGKNAQGKTNILEAVHVLCTGRSHRTSKDREMIYHDQAMNPAERAYICATCRQRDGNHQLEVAISQRGRKAIRVNGSSVLRLGDLMGHMNAVMFSPEDISLIRGGPAYRRRFMDMTLSQVRGSYFFTLQRYQQALLQRNELLKIILRQGKGEETLDVWDEQLAQAGAELTFYRQEFAEYLGKNAKSIHHQLTGGQEDLKLVYETALQGEPEQRKAQMLEGLSRSRSRDIRMGVTNFGPHRDDMAVQINGADARADASQGQRRTAVLSMKLAQLTMMEEITGEAPLLLLDDVFSELDGARREMLQSYISRVQTFITCVDMEGLALKKQSGPHCYQVEAGRITQL
jgi:DNA replication and repair protein RecF